MPSPTNKEPISRMIIVRIDDIINLFKDYLDESDIPPDTKPLRLFLNPRDKKIGILCESTKWKPVNETIEIPVQFKLKRIYSV
ncbi:MAG: hypothetical protein JRJ78_16735 [Deltaproteobacteria bacterium]|nr:hypothetical protein [Deltaproteobacteria bacterium]